MLVLDNVYLKSNVKDVFVVLGSFDGFHKGHLSLMNEAKNLAKKNNGKSMVFTFKNHPKTLTYKDIEVKLISTNYEKIDILRKSNIDILVFKNFDKNIMTMSPEEFIKWLVKNYNIKGIIVGENFKFGFKNTGDVSLLKEFSHKYKFLLKIMRFYNFGYSKISSTRIRYAINNGDVILAKNLLKREYSIEGKVIGGKKIGRTIGFPTANLSFEKDKIIPRIGVYYTKVLIDGIFFKGITSVGNNPTVNGKEITIETYILNFDEEIYGKYIKVSFISKIREQIKFKSLNLLIEQLKKDKKYAENAKNNIFS